MNTNEHLIWDKNRNRDITADVQSCKYNSVTSKYDVVFRNGKLYSYSGSSIEWLKNPKQQDIELTKIFYLDREFFQVKAIYVFKGTEAEYWRIQFLNGKECSYDSRELKIVKSCLSNPEAKSCLSYLRRIAGVHELCSADGTVLLGKKYEQLKFVGNNTALAVYLNPKKHKVSTYENKGLIFPFGGNASQFEAVEKALKYQISVVQGPPGTGKTQTILNIIANVLAEGKSVQIVSNNNSATVNVWEKLSLDRYGMGFLVASLGNAGNKKEFLENQSGRYPDFNGWEQSLEMQQELYARISILSDFLSGVFRKKERLAKVRQELDSLLLEIKYFEQYCEENDAAGQPARPRRSLKSAALMELWQECYEFSVKDRPVSFWYKIKSILFYGISDWKFYKKGLAAIITRLQNLFYQTRKLELEEEAGILLRDLETVNAEAKMEELTDCSMKYLRAKLYDRYGGRKQREIFKEDGFWRNSRQFMKEYPVILSTTFSSRSSLGENTVYDYLIMDEASQVDIATGALALSCAENAVIVGDLKQLPNVVSEEMRQRTDVIWQSYKLPEGYCYTENSFLKSLCQILPDTPQTLLREHYRCHPKIIGFCNQKFYNNELIVMTDDHGEPDTLSVYKTVAGSHRRGHLNQRQIDVTCREALTRLQENGTDDIGIIAPYNEQVEAIRKTLGGSIEAATVHKFQGREKDTIILTTVDDVATDFSDNPYLLNVAVSRAKKRLCLIVSGEEQPADSNIGDLVSYIEYNNFEVVQSEIYSVFDYLYRQYTAERMEFLKKHRRISEYDSENLMYGMIQAVLAEYPQLNLGVICHQPLNMLIRDPRYLDDESYGIPLLRFATNGSGEQEKIENLLKEMLSERLSRKTT